MGLKWKGELLLTDVGFWFIGIALAYTLLLILIGQVARKRAADGSGYFIGGRSFNKWFVAVCITGLFSGSAYISILELSYLQGVSAVWYGVAETVQVLLIALIFIAPFRKKALVTISGLIGDHYGSKVRALAGAITGFTFPMWSVATALAFASAMTVFTGISLIVSVAITAFLLYLYLRLGGMWSIGFTQLSNVIVFAIMLIIGFYAFTINPGFAGLKQLMTEKPEMFTASNAGLQTIIVWFGTFLINVVLAQAAFQMALSCKTEKEGQQGLLLAALFGLPLIIGAVVFGLAAAYVVPGETLALQAIPLYLMETLPAPLVGLFFLGFWAAALSWGAPCQFSGATSLGRDVGMAFNPKAREADLIKYTQRSLLILTVFMVVFALLRSEQSAWWNVLAWTTRNSATFAPVIAALLWPAVSKRAVFVSLFTGSFAGLIWYHLGGWAVNDFFLNTHPVWVGMTANISTICLITVIERAKEIRVDKDGRFKKLGYVGLMLTFALLVFVASSFNSLYETGLIGLVIFFISLSLFASLIGFVTIRENSSQVHLAQEGKVHV